jgi:MFS transporter, DHA2 family, methylenomycin A resistance protein
MELPDSAITSATGSSSIRTRIWTALVLVAVALGFVMAMLDVTVVNVALGAIQHDFRTPLSGLVWIVDAYTLTFAAFLMLGGALADRVGAKSAYIVGLVWFIVASALCGAAGSASFLICSRLLQGASAALFMPSSLSLLTEAFPDRQTRGRMLALWTAVIACAAGSGPMVGGILVSMFGWRSIFYLNLPLGLLGVALTALVIEPSARKMHPFDFPTHGLLVAALAGLSFAMIEGPAKGWLSSTIISSELVSILAVWISVKRERTSHHPVLPVTLARNSRFWALNAMGFIVNFVMFGQIFVVSLFLQKVLGANALTTGMDMLPMMCLLSVGNLLSGYFSARLTTRMVIALGLLPAAVAAAITAFFGGHCAFWILASSVAVCNGGLGLAIPAMLNGVMHEAGKIDANIGAAALNANRQIGALAGVAAAGIALNAIPDWSIALRIVFIGFALLLMGALFLVHLVHKNEA